MMSFDRTTARAWARETMRGCANVVIPSYTADLAALNPAGIRHDVRWEITNGFWGALLVAETSITRDEYQSFVECAVDEAQGDLHLIFHAAFNTLEENVEMGRRAQAAGVELALLTYPANFHPRDAEEVFEHTKAFCDGVDMGVILFPVPLWNFERIHPASIPLDVIERLIDACPNVVAVKAEGGFPSIAGFTHVHKALGDRVIVTMPVEDQGIPLKTIVDLPWMGTSYMEYFGRSVPTMFDLLERGAEDEAMELFWRIHPARSAAHQLLSIAGSNFSHRMLWKYLGWLNGLNGGPLRAPTMRLRSNQMELARSGHRKAGLNPTEDPDELFYVGRT